MEAVVVALPVVGREVGVELRPVAEISRPIPRGHWISRARQRLQLEVVAAAHAAAGVGRVPALVEGHPPTPWPTPRESLSSKATR